MPLWTLGVAYLAGSFPTAYLVGTANGVDLRTVGSGNLGATNVFRTLGWKWGLLVYLVDGLKGFTDTEVTIQANTSTSPVVIGQTYLVMPVQVRE